MSNLSFSERSILEKLLQMSSGFVLDFTNRTFQQFVGDSVNLDILDQKYHATSGSKANRLRELWKQESDHTVGLLLTDLLKYVRKTTFDTSSIDLANKCDAIAIRLLQSKSDTEKSTEPLLFISYARPDIQVAEALAILISNAGCRAWFDKKDLKGGQDWEFEIRQQISKSALVLVGLSTKSVDRKGFFHKEMRYAVDEAMKLPKGKVYIMPVRFNDCPIPDDLRHLHALDLFLPSASLNLIDSINSAIHRNYHCYFESQNSFTSKIQQYNTI